MILMKSTKLNSFSLSPAHLGSFTVLMIILPREYPCLNPTWRNGRYRLKVFELCKVTTTTFESSLLIRFQKQFPYFRKLILVLIAQTCPSMTQKRSSRNSLPWQFKWKPQALISTDIACLVSKAGKWGDLGIESQRRCSSGTSSVYFHAQAYQKSTGTSTAPHTPQGGGARPRGRRVLKPR